MLALHPLDLALELADPGLRLFALALGLGAQLVELLLEHIAGRRRLGELLGPALEGVERRFALGFELRHPAALGLGQLLETLPQLAAVLLETRPRAPLPARDRGPAVSRASSRSASSARRCVTMEVSSAAAQPDLTLRLLELELEPRHAILELARRLGVLLAQPVGLFAQLFDAGARLIALLLQALLRLLESLLRAVALAGDRDQILDALLDVDAQRVELLLAPALTVARLLQALLHFLDPLLALAQVEHHFPALALLEAQALLRLAPAAS